MSKPKAGDKIYVFSTLHVSHGVDDFRGGLCTVTVTETRIQGGKEVTFVEVAEDLGRWMLWETYLEPKQEALKEAFGTEKGHADPDARAEFNRWEPDPE